MPYPIKPVKKILKHYYNGEISVESLVYVRDILIDFTNLLAEQTVKVFDEMNEQREKSGIPSLKRLDKKSFEKVWKNIYKEVIHKNIGEVGNHNEILLCQDGANNEQHK